MYKTEIPYSIEELIEGIEGVIKANNLKSAYIRPIIYRGVGSLGLNPRVCPVEVSLSAWEWGAYLGKEGNENGIRAQISSWRRPAPDTLPALAKAGGMYLSSQLIKMEALDNGFAEGIALDYFGNLSEGSGENIFIVKDQTLYTPTAASSLLAGITRDTVMYLAKELQYEIKEQVVPREFLYIADEVFLTGTAAEVTPVVEIDHMKIDSGKRGAITKSIQDSYLDLVTGNYPKAVAEWLHIVK